MESWTHPTFDTITVLTVQQPCLQKNVILVIQETIQFKRRGLMQMVRVNIPLNGARITAKTLTSVRLQQMKMLLTRPSLIKMRAPQHAKYRLGTIGHATRTPQQLQFLAQQQLTQKHQ